jgi:hypothetical protein
VTNPIRSQAELLDAIRARRDELNISHETIDNIAGFQAGYTSKLLCTPPMKNPGPMSLGALLGALGMALMPVPDPEMIAKVEDRWEPRKRPQKLPVLAVGLSMQNEVPAMVLATPELILKTQQREHMKMLGRLGGLKGGSKGGKRRARAMKKRARQAAASHAARMRWAKRASVLAG